MRQPKVKAVAVSPWPYCLAPAAPAPACQGRFLNPITDVCWWCVFPVRIGGISISLGAKNEDHSSMTANPIMPLR